MYTHTHTTGLSDTVVKNSPAKTGDTGSIPVSGRFPGAGNGKPTSVFLPGESYGQRSRGGGWGWGYSPWDHKESKTTEHT